MGRVAQQWRKIRKEKRKGLVLFLTAGDPSLSATRRFIQLLDKQGADLIELGVPFSDPMADGPVIQRSSERALARGVTLRKILALVRSLRREVRTPLLLMGYYNPIHSYGLRLFAHDAARAGVDAVLVVDLPPEESAPLDRELKKVGIDLIYLLTPTSDGERIRIVCRRARGFVYFVSMTGITGARLTDEAVIRKKIAQIRRRTRLPIAIGFGIRTPEQAGRIARLADGVVIGSVLVDLVSRPASSLSQASRLSSFVRRMKRVLG